MLVVLSMIVLIVILIGYIAFFKTPVAGKMKETGEKVSKKAGDIKKEAMHPGKKIKLTYCPTISFRSPDETAYERIKMARPKITIGSGKNCDIRLDDETVEKTHAIIEKVVKNDDAYYEFINLSKYNPAEYLNSDQGVKRKFIGYKKAIRIERAEVFKIGQTKVFVEIPSRDEDRLTKTEIEFMGKKGNFEEDDFTVEELPEISREGITTEKVNENKDLVPARTMEMPAKTMEMPAKTIAIPPRTIRYDPKRNRA